MNDQQTPQNGYVYPPPGAPPPPPNPYYSPYVKPQRLPYDFSSGDAAYACFTLALGFLCWHFELFSNLGAFLVLVVALIGTMIYLNAKGVRQTGRSIAVFIICAAGSLPFLLFDAIGMYLLLLAIVLFAGFYWIAVSTGNSVEERVSGFVLTDWVNQTFVVPFSNFLGLFVSIKTASKDTKRGKTVLVGVIGLCIAIPLIIGVTTLLIESDAGFEKFANDFSEWIGIEDIGTYLLKFIGGIPIACYLFGSVYGNYKKRYTDSMTKEQAVKNLEAAHRIPRAAIIPPLAVFCILYIIYIIVMSVYLFSGLTGKLPDEWFVYAEYARRGFFELCGVAAINLFILAFTYSFAKRMAGEYPKAMRILSGLLCIMTELLVATAVSKMLLYADAYGLSRLRIYTFWFLILLFIVFAILIIWHIRPFNAGRPIVITSVCLVIALCLANTDDIIAKYNVWQYQEGKIRTSAVDTDMLSRMSDAVLPYLVDLRDNSPNFGIRLSAREAIKTINTRHIYGNGMLPESKNSFRSWSIQSAMLKKYLPEDQALSAEEADLQVTWTDEKTGSVQAENYIIIRGYFYSKTLTELDLSGLYLRDVEIVSLKYMTNLTSLYLDRNEITDLSPLAGLTNLENLSLRNNGIIDLSPLAGLENLVNLSIASNDIRYLSRSDSLLPENITFDLTALANLKNLTNLDLSYNSIYDIEPLSGLTNLTDLNLNNNDISDLSTLSGFTNLTWLRLAGNEISEVTPLSSLTKLKDLSLSYNNIQDLTPLESLTNLVWLDLNSNDLSDIKPLSALKNLTYANLEDNHISDWSYTNNIRNIQGRK